MPNPSTIALDLTEQYERAVNGYENLSLSKGSREAYLAEARRLAAELGIEGPPNYNGRPAQRRFTTTATQLGTVERNIIVTGLRMVRRERALEDYTGESLTEIDDLIEKIRVK